MAEDLRVALTDMMGTVSWEVLKPHMKRDAVVIVDLHLDLVEVGMAIASDNTQIVARWINEQLILKPTAQQLSQWSESNMCFQSLIVQPYVLIQVYFLEDELSAAINQTP